LSADELDELEGQLSKLPPRLTKHDMEPAYEAMAEWLGKLPSHSQVRILKALRSWLVDRSHPWHSQAALEMAVRLSDVALLHAAIDEASREGIHEIDRDGPYPPWLAFDLLVIAAISRWKGDPGAEAKNHLSRLRTAAQTATTYPSRLLASRAWLTQCLLNQSSRDKCVAGAMGVVRSWRDERLLRSALSLLHAYFWSDPDMVSKLSNMLTPEELAYMWPVRRSSR
jgi:hypothetical protein